MKIIETLDWILDKEEKNERIGKEDKQLLNAQLINMLTSKNDSGEPNVIDVTGPQGDALMSKIASFFNNIPKSNDVSTPQNEQLSFEEKIRLNIEFVHSLGLKCDCVGWSKLDLQDPRADEILSAIDSFCKKNGWNARGVYTRKYSDFSSDWYEIVPTEMKDNTISDYHDEYESEQGEKVKVLNLLAYHELRPSPKCIDSSVLVPERFKDACIRHGITDVDFCWAKDKGKYQAEQYFYLYGNRQIPNVAIGGKITIQDKEKIQALGGQLTKVADIFYDLQQIDLQDCYIESDIPNCSIAFAYSPKVASYCSSKFLIHKSFAEILLKEKAISESDLAPAMVIKEPFGAYTLEKTTMPHRPAPVYLKNSISEYEKLKNAERPLRTVSEKDALKLLRLAKKERKDDFEKALAKAKAPEVTQTAYAPVLPYYLVANGGALSDEYELLSFDKAVEENELFANELTAEELLETKPEGIVIAKCADGDNILLCVDGKVIRFSHEAPIVTEEWVSLHQFVADSIND